MKKNKQNHKTAWFALNALAASMLLMNSAHALQGLDDQEMRSVNAQDGVHAQTTYDAVDVEQLYWQDGSAHGSTDKTYSSSNLRAIADGFHIRPNTDSSYGLGTDYKINTGSSGAGQTGLDLELSANPALISVDNFLICDTEASSRCSVPIGNVAVKTSTPIGIIFKTRDGLFSKTSQSSLDLGIKNANIFLGQTAKMTAGDKLNQLILKNMNFNFLGKGVMFVDAVDGFKVQTNQTGATPTNASITQTPNATYGYVDFRRTSDPGAGLTAGSYVASEANSGLNLEFMLNKNVSTATPTSPYTLDPTQSPTGAKGLIRIGASGRMVNGFLQLRGTNSGTKADPVNTNITDPSLVTNKYGDPNGTNILGQADNGLALSTGCTTAPCAKNIMGNTGLAFRMKAEFTTDNDTMLTANSTNGDLAGRATTLEIGSAGLNTYGFEFGNLSGLVRDASGNLTRGSFDSGNLYINLVDTKSVLLPANYFLQTSRFGNGGFLTKNTDYTQSIHDGTSNINPYSLLMSIRGGEFQAISRRGRFTNSARAVTVQNPTPLNALTDPSPGVPQINEHPTDNKWGLALPFYNLNANMALYGTTVDASKVYYYDTSYFGGTGRNQVNSAAKQTPRLGFSLAMTTDGIDRDTNFNKLGNKTTSIIVIDGGDRGDGKSTDYYMGIRNIDMLMKGNGSIGVENGSFNVSLKDMLIAIAGEIAAGYLPGSTYKQCVGTTSATCTANNNGIVPLNNFANKSDVLFGVKLRIGGSMDFSLIPNSEYNSNGTGSRLSIVGDFNLTGQGNTIQITDPADGSTIGLDNLQGKMAFNNAIVIAPDLRGGSIAANPTYGEGIVNFNTTLTFNPDRQIGDVFRAKDINLYPPNPGNTAINGARLGELAITGGRLKSEFGIIPRN